MVDSPFLLNLVNVVQYGEKKNIVETISKKDNGIVLLFFGLLSFILAFDWLSNFFDQVFLKNFLFFCMVVARFDGDEENKDLGHLFLFFPPA